VNWSHAQPRKDVVCSSCLRLRRRLAGKQAEIFRLRARLQKTQSLLAQARDRIAELEQLRPPAAAELAPTASNSSIPPSANPLGAPRPVVKKPTGRKPGGQIGHRGVSRMLLPVETMDQVVPHRPGICQHCHQALDAQCHGELVGRHQVAELPGRAVAEMIAQTLGCPIALGSIANREQELSHALDQPYADLSAAIRQAPSKYVDETGWKLHGQDRWLFAAVDRDKAVFRIEKTRTRPALLRLLDVRQGVICSDRFAIYDLWPLARRQLCWAHLKRDFTAVVERGGTGETIGLQLLEITHQVFALWHAFRHRKISRRALRRDMAPLRRRMREVLQAGAECGQKKTTGLCRALLKREKALWRFTRTPGIEPTNNLAERMLRPAVIWRKKSFGSHSLAGCQYVQRMLSVIQTLRLRGADVLDYLSAAVEARRKDLPPPSIPQATAKPDARAAKVGAASDGNFALLIPALRKIA
jgi:transposase